MWRRDHHRCVAMGNNLKPMRAIPHIQGCTRANFDLATRFIVMKIQRLHRLESVSSLELRERRRCRQVISTTQARQQ